MGYVVAFAGRRDFYQVPIALVECGLLDAFCTDFYFDPKSVWQALLVPRRFRRRYAPELDKKVIYTSLSETCIQALSYFGGFDLERTFSWVDSDIGRRARAIAAKTNSDILSYSNYALESFSDPRFAKRKKILFLYHPHTKLSFKILEDDFEKYGFCKWSFERVINHEPRSERIEEELALADRVICASSFTKSSVQASGVSHPEIDVVPYGCNTADIIFDPREKSFGRSHFLFVGQGVQRKGLHHLFLAWQKANLKNAVLEVVLSVADPGIMAIVPEGVLVHHGALPYSSLLERFQKANIFVMPSLVEGFGLVYLEALAAGCYCIYTPNTGLPDLNPPIEVAIETPVADVDALSDKLIGTHAQVQRNLLDPVAIRRFAEVQSWGRFRQGIVKALRF